jgi:hypothetical protein
MMGEEEGTKPTSAPDHSLQKTSSNRRLIKRESIRQRKGRRRGRKAWRKKLCSRKSRNQPQHIQPVPMMAEG